MNKRVSMLHHHCQAPYKILQISPAFWGILGCSIMNMSLKTWFVIKYSFYKFKIAGHFQIKAPSTLATLQSHKWLRFVARIFSPVSYHCFHALSITIVSVARNCGKLLLVPATNSAFCGWLRAHTSDLWVPVMQETSQM